MTILKVARTSSPQYVAGAIAGEIRKTGEVELRAIGPEAVNQTVKAIIVARRFLSPEGIDIVDRPEKIDPPEGQEDSQKTMIAFKVNRV
jgi:stage V sporulation protein S